MIYQQMNDASVMHCHYGLLLFYWELDHVNVPWEFSDSSSPASHIEPLFASLLRSLE